MNVVEWAETHWGVRDPITGAQTLIRLRPWQRAALLAMFPADGSPSRYDTFLLSTVKKAGKTTLDAIAVCYAAMTFPPPETAYVVANDEAQAQERVFDLIVDAVRDMGLERQGAARITKSEIVFPETGSKIVAIAADFAGAAGATFGISSFTELWAFRHESHIRLFEELTPLPSRRSLRIVDSYAGFSGESPVLEPMWQRALAGERLGGDLPIFTSGRLWAFIDTGEAAQERGWLGDRAEMERYYESQRQSLRPGTYRRLHLNERQSSEEEFISADEYDACVVVGMAPAKPDPRRSIWVGIDAATKHDSASVQAVGRNEQTGLLELARGRIWKPPKGGSLDLEATVEREILRLSQEFRIVGCYFDPYQMQRSAASLKGAGVPMREFPQTSGNLTAAGQALWDTLRDETLLLYPDAGLREHCLNAVAVQTDRGWRLTKVKSSRKIDAAAALSFAVLHAVKARSSGRRSRMIDGTDGRVISADLDSDSPDPWWFADGMDKHADRLNW